MSKSRVCGGRIAILLATSTLVVGAAGCLGTPKLGDAGNKEVPKISDEKCDPSKVTAEPLLVEWEGTSRARLETLLRKGVVPVKYKDCKLEMVTGCLAPPKTHYVYAPTNPKVDTLEFSTSRDLHAKIPLGAASLSGELKSSGQLNLHMTIVGRWDSNRTTIATDELTGTCDGVTHVVTGVTAGAFEMTAGAESSVGADVSVAGAGVGGSSKKGKKIGKKDGELDACQKATLDDKTPPASCGSMIQVELVPVLAGKGSAPVAGVTAPSCPEGMATIPGGTFKRERGDEATLGSFCMDKYEITIGEYGECVKAGKCKPTSTTVGEPNLKEEDKRWRSTFCPGNKMSSDPKQPASCLDWDMAVSYCWWKGRRLPSDVEFEWAARGGEKGTKYPWGNDAPTDAHICSSLPSEARGYRERFGSMEDWLSGLKPGTAFGSCVVGARPKGANPWGVEDLLGNVWEWVWAEKDGVKTYPVAGSGWNTGNDTYVKASGIWTSDWSSDSRESDTGARCVAAPK